MVIVGEIAEVNMICPYCKSSFQRPLEHQKKPGLLSILIKNHPNTHECPPFIAFIDSNGKHRGSQKIDDIGEESIDEQILDDARQRINQLDELRFYHLKLPRKDGRRFEYKYAGVQDKVFMSTTFYFALQKFLLDNRQDNTFGTVEVEKDSDFEGGLLVYGKYLGLVYTIFWKDHKALVNKNLDELKGYANLTVERLLDIYDIADLFF